MYGLLGSETQVMIGNFVKDEFSETSVCLSFGTWYEVDIKQLCSASIHKYNSSILLLLSDNSQFLN